MRTLSATLEAIQKLGRYKPLFRVVLTYTGETSYEYTNKSANPVKIIDQPESPDSQTAEIIIDNSDKTLTDIDLEGYKAVVSWGATTSEGDEYSSCAPLWVIAKTCYSAQGRLVCRLSLAGKPNVLHEEKAIDPYTPATDDTKTLKTLIREIAADAGASFHPSYQFYPKHNVTFDSEDSLIDTYIPKESFRIRLNDRRWEKISELLFFTGCVMRVEDDEDIHIFEPTISGASYDYEYELLASGEHTFFNKAYRKRLVIPNIVFVRSHLVADTDFYAGQASDTSSISEIGYKFEYHELRLESDEQAEAIADAFLAHYKLAAEGGSGLVPMNFGAEVYDYNKFTDSRAGDSVTGNIGYLNRHWDVDSGKMPTMQVAFGKPRLSGWLNTLNTLLSSLAAEDPVIRLIIERLDEIMTYLEEQRRWGIMFQSIFTTYGDVMYRGALEAERLPPDAGKGYNFLRSRGAGLSPVWTDIEDMITYITGDINKMISAALAIPAPSISLIYAEDHSGGAFTATDTLPITVPTIAVPTTAVNAPEAVDGAIADDGGDQTNETTEANSATQNDITLLPATPEVNDAYYFGADAEWDWLSLKIDTVGEGVWTIVWEYYDGDSWELLTGLSDETDGFEADHSYSDWLVDTEYELGDIAVPTTPNGYYYECTTAGTSHAATEPTWGTTVGETTADASPLVWTCRALGHYSVAFTRPTDWATSTIILEDKYWIRARVSAYTSIVTQPKATQAWIGTH